MKSKDLRIGNLVESRLYPLNKRRLLQVSKINQSHIDDIHHSFIFPVEIEEESILKFEDIKKESAEKYFIQIPVIKSEIHLVWFKGIWFVELHSQHSTLPVILNFRFIHELQNLYSLLTGGELTLKN
jgi:hypothetical protein